MLNVPPLAMAAQQFPVDVSQKVTSLPSQSVLTEQGVLQERPLEAQVRLCGQTTPPFDAQSPAALQKLLVSVLPEQLGGAPQDVVSAGYTQAPLPSQEVAPQMGSLVVQAAWQQLPLPLTPHTPELQESFWVQVNPSLNIAAQLPARQ